MQPAKPPVDTKKFYKSICRRTDNLHGNRFACKSRDKIARVRLIIKTNLTLNEMTVD